ncbi:drug/metabolite transporter (DMT)-like permease [Crossiella equi]|uniref:Drug/metabolite transporter (DMT)-like permease n=1 Tax=Crossiella equi TaxID=130796 RepID=A0ABS5AHM2_9PSEU|nr:DMT family transporter [Crossiella equi]MBP2475872.1 drug/metabolite transporter (DMT)-like permease [Crossiella equi]
MRDRTWLVALAASLWGTDALLRKPLAEALPSATVVFWEHLIVVALLLPWVPRALRALGGLAWSRRLAVVVIGVGSSAVATALFTAAFRYGDPVTPLVLQKAQPVFVLLLAFLLLGERPRAHYLWFAVPALAGAWLLGFRDPLDVRVSAAVPALLALGAAALWAGGTVLGRLVSDDLRPWEVTVLRFTIGLPASAAVVPAVGAPFLVSWGNAPALVLLAVVPGLLALSLYYLGLRATPAARATLAELAFPATAALIGVGLLGASLTGTQWLGFALLVASVTALGWRERTGRSRTVVVSPGPVPARPRPTPAG